MGRCKLNVDTVKLPVVSSRPPEVGKEVQTENGQYVEFQKHEIYSQSKIIPEAEGVSIKSCKGKQYSGVIFGDWDDKEMLRSSTWRESETVRKINSNIEVLQHKRIKIFSDNKNVQSVLQIGRGKEDLHKVACDINEVCEQHGIEMCPEWIPRGQNQTADDLSRCGDSDDWSVSNQFFFFRA